MRSEDAKRETRGVSSELLTEIDLGPEIEGMAGRHLRMRLFTFEPGAVFGPIHDHVGRPGIVYILQGTITDHRDGVATDYGPGVGWPEDKNTRHWLENRGTTTAVEISVDLVASAPDCSRHEPTTQVIDEPANHRFRYTEDGIDAVLVYQVRDDQLILMHTGVPEAIGGRGIAGQLVEAAVYRAKVTGETLQPWCPYARKWLQEHAELAATIPIDWREPPPERTSVGSTE